MYYPDLTKIKDHSGIFSNKFQMITIGWLDKHHSYTKGLVSEEFIAKLKQIKPRIATKGYHYCPFCNKARSSEQFIIKAINYIKPSFYNVPQMIVHYIEKHNYKPPMEFIIAVMVHKL